MVPGRNVFEGRRRRKPRKKGPELNMPKNDDMTNAINVLAAATNIELAELMLDVGPPIANRGPLRTRARLVSAKLLEAAKE